MSLIFKRTRFSFIRKTFYHNAVFNFIFGKISAICRTLVATVVLMTTLC